MPKDPFSLLFFLCALVLTSVTFGMNYDERNGYVVKTVIAQDPQTVDPLGPDHSIPSGTLRSSEGKDLDLEDLVHVKATILFFYQGEWSESANRQLDQLAMAEPALAKLGYQVIAVSPDKPERLKETLARHHLNFPLFSDRAMRIAQGFGVAYWADPKAFQKAGIRLEDYTGNSRMVLPAPTFFGIDAQGTIGFFHCYPDPAKEMNWKYLLKAAETMMKK